MITTAFLSMWLSNTATTAMMVPIAEAVLIELKADKKRTTTKTSNIEMEEKEPGVYVAVLCRVVLSRGTSCHT